MAGLSHPNGPPRLAYGDLRTENARAIFTFQCFQVAAFIQHGDTHGSEFRFSRLGECFVGNYGCLIESQLHDLPSDNFLCERYLKEILLSTMPHWSLSLRGQVGLKSRRDGTGTKA